MTYEYGNIFLIMNVNICTKRRRNTSKFLMIQEEGSEDYLEGKKIEVSRRKGLNWGIEKILEKEEKEIT